MSTEQTVAWNPRYLAYCRAHGETDPVVMRERNLQRWPGGPGVGFILWMSQRWQQWDAMRKQKPWNHVRSAEEYKEFDQWLATNEFPPVP